MKPLIKIIALLIVAILIISSVYVTFLTEPVKSEEEPEDETGDDDEDDTNDQNDTEDDNGGNVTWDTAHYVFIEEATGSWCAPCVKVAKILKEIYESEKYPFYYVSMVADQENTADYLEDHYNILAYPTVYIDGGYEIIMGGAIEKSVFEDGIKSALSRNFSSVFINLTAEWDENNGKINVNGKIKNDETTNYKGVLRVYLAEIVSTEWLDQSKKPYHLAFLEFIIDKSVDIPAQEIYNFTKSIDDSGLDPENLMIFAAVFNSESTKKYSDPDDLDGDGSKNEFDAHYVDNCAATEVVKGGNLPPSAGISLPEAGYLHLFGKPIFDFIFIFDKKTITIGKIDIKAEVEDDSGIEKVEFYLDDELKFTDEEAPYEFTINKAKLLRRILIRRHYIKVTAYDTEGKTNTAEMEVLTFLF